MAASWCFPHLFRNMAPELSLWRIFETSEKSSYKSVNYFSAAGLKPLQLGVRRRGLASIAVRSPRDGKVFAEIPDLTEAEVGASVAQATDCAASSCARPTAVEDRIASLRALGSAIRAESERLAVLESTDCGRALVETHADMGTCADLMVALSLSTCGYPFFCLGLFK